MSHVLPYLFILSCPISMGVMMWLMMRGMHGKDESKAPDARTAQLEREVEALREAQRDRERAEAR